MRQSIFAIQIMKNLKFLLKRMVKEINSFERIFLIMFLLCSRCQLYLHLEYLQVFGEGNKKPNWINHEKSVDYHPTVMHAECDTLGQGMISKPFWFMIFYGLCSILFGMLLDNCYKVFGQFQQSIKFNQLGIDDAKLTVLGSVQAVCNGGSRFGQAVLFDKIGFKKVYLIIAVINLIFTVVIGYINDSYAVMVESFGLYWILLCYFHIRNIIQRGA
ncbi:unnamed protein product [Paramecium primaurelia]|uniref:Uncharacterized protein n=1 Tax=Paramecium primaurelia TaxID=5886 RepID=A0A8S1NAS6_PARPR|nr:unnamed protein product [Paramecium primaurelia]